MALVVSHANQGFWDTASSIFGQITAADVDDICVFVIFNEKSGDVPITNNVSSDHLTWTKYDSQVLSGQSEISIWWAHVTTPLVAEDVLVELDRATDDSAMISFNVAGANTTSPFDISSGQPFYASNGTGSNSTMQITGITTAVDATVDFFVYGSYEDIDTNVPSGYTQTSKPQNSDGVRFANMCSGYFVNSSPLSSVTRTAGSPNSVKGWQAYSFSIVASGETPPLTVDIGDDGGLDGMLQQPPLIGSAEDEDGVIGIMTVGEVAPRSQQMVICVGT